MLEAVLIDDERPALRALEMLLKDHSEISVTGTYINPVEALGKLDQLKPQVVFLDINMPQLKGIDAASRILDSCPDTEIVFVTAYDQYAVEAFELQALDYILKPVSKERFEKTIRRVITKTKAAASRRTDRSLIIKTFGRFSVGYNGEEPIKWRTEKTKELFAFLLCHANREVSKEVILEAVYRGMDAEKASHQLYNGIYYIRKTLQQYGIERTQIAVQGSYMLRLGGVDLDSLSFKETLQKAGLAGADMPKKSIKLLEMAEAVYAADFFEEADWRWAQTWRQGYLNRYLRLLADLAQLHLQTENFVKAEELLLKSFKKDPYSEEVSRSIIELYLTTGRNSLALKHYKRYAKILKEDLGIKPTENLTKILKKL